MGKIHVEFESEYEIGDLVVFKKDNEMKVGLIEGYYVDDSVIWYNIRINKQFVYTYSNGGDIAEFDILQKMIDQSGIRQYIVGGGC